MLEKLKKFEIKKEELANIFGSTGGGTGGGGTGSGDGDGYPPPPKKECDWWDWVCQYN